MTSPVVRRLRPPGPRPSHVDDRGPERGRCRRRSSSMCGLATWAPNHKKTWPWRFALFTGDGRARLGATMVDDMIEADSATRASGQDAHEVSAHARGARRRRGRPRQRDARRREPRRRRRRGPEPAARRDHARARQLLVDAGARRAHRACSNCAASTPTDRIVAMIYLGWANGPAPAPERPTVELKQIAD